MLRFVGDPVPRKRPSRNPGLGLTGPYIIYSDNLPGPHHHRTIIIDKLHLNLELHKAGLSFSNYLSESNCIEININQGYCELSTM